MKTAALILACLCSGVAFAQAELTPRDYFDNAARNYLDGDKRAAIQTLHDGLSAHPSDEAMRKLAEELLRQMEQEQQQEQQQQDQEQERQEQQENQQQDQGQGGNSDQQEQQQGNQGEESPGEDGRESGENGEENEGKADDEGQEDQNSTNREGAQQQEQDGQQSGAGQSGSPGEEQPMQVGVISKDEAARLLKSLNQQDKQTKARVMKAQTGQQPKSRSDKDW